MLAINLLGDVGSSLREGFFMFWETLWALVLGFGLSGMVQAFVPKEQMERVMGDHGPAAVGRASFLGMVSSSCSYAATAMAKSLFQKGADFVTAMVFMFASTNLVIELGIVLLILLGWQFTAAEFVGGPIMIALLVITSGWFLQRKLTDPAREQLRSGTTADGHDHQMMTGVSDERQAELERKSWREKLTSKAAWSDAAAYTMADIKMLRSELVIGYVVAGFLAVLVSPRVWNDVFLRHHGLLTSVENVVIGPFIALVSFVCSIGNVPLAAALWKGGISFGGVISFIFADLITFPLLLIYRKYYGTRLALRLLVQFWLVMSAAGLIVEGIFTGLHLVPTHRPREIAPAHFAWNYTTFLNFAFLVVISVLFWLYRNRGRLGGGVGYAIDPVCGMQVRTADAPASTTHDGVPFFFCSDHCRERFEAEPGRFAGDHATASEQPHEEAHGSAAIDPACGMTVDPRSAAARRVRDGHEYWFCSTGCAEHFDSQGDQSPTETPSRHE